MRTILSILTVVFMAQVASAAAPSTAASRDAKAAALASAKRLYPGGHDEDDLKVQDNLPTPTARIDRKQLDSKVIKTTGAKSDEDDDAQVEE